MKFQTFNVSPKMAYWSKIFSKFISIQLVVQGLNIICGILLIRVLSKPEYAYFTIANSMQGTMNLLADLGIGSGLSAIGGRIWQDKYRFGQLIQTAMQLRRYLAIFSIVLVTPILLWMLIGNGSSIAYASLLTLAILIELHFYLSIGVLGVVPRLYSQFDRIQQLDLIDAGARLVILLGASLTFLNAIVAAFASTIASGLKTWMLQHWITDTIDTKTTPNQEDRKEILRIVKLQAPEVVFYCLQGQITIWLISIFGTTQNVAEIGALGRLTVIFTLFNSVMNGIMLPSIARCQEANLFKRRYTQVILAYGLLSVPLLAITAIYPNQILWILGSNYSNLKKELLFAILNTNLYNLLALMSSVNSTKAWIAPPLLTIGQALLGRIILLFLVDVSTVRGILLFSIFSTVPSFIVTSCITWKGVRSMPKLFNSP